MFVVVYSFKVKKGREPEFQASWKGLTELIFEYEGSLGSRLHLSDEGIYIAYAQWPDRDTWEKSGGNLPDEADTFRNAMGQCCDDIQVSNKLSMIEDLLKTDKHHSKT